VRVVMNKMRKMRKMKHDVTTTDALTFTAMLPVLQMVSTITLECLPGGLVVVS
jgi:hypothetical protein